MEEGKQTNIPNYFSNLKRSTSDLFSDSKLEVNFNSNSSFKRDKKTEIVKIGDCTNYTINKFFIFSKVENCLSEIKSGLKKLEINSKQQKDFNISSFNTGLSNNNLISGNIMNYFKKDRVAMGGNDVENSIEIKQNENNLEDHKIFSLDNFEHSESKRETKNFIEDESVKGENLNFNGNLNSQKGKNIKYEDIKITHWVKHTTYSDLKGVNESLFQNILKYLSFKELTQTCLVNKTFQNFYKNTLSSYPYFNPLDTSKIHTKKEFSEMLKKGKNLHHIKKLYEIIKNDFGGEKGGPDNFYAKVILIMNLSSVEDLKYKGTLLDSFKIKSKKDYHINNFISNDSVLSICSSSRFTMRELLLRGCFKLTDKISNNSIEQCIFLERLELSFNENIGDEAISKICKNCPNLKVLNLSNLKSITEKSVKSISGLKILEGLDISENTSIKGDSLLLLQSCKKIKRLILNGIKLTDSNFIFTDYLQDLETLSISSKKI